MTTRSSNQKRAKSQDYDQKYFLEKCTGSGDFVKGTFSQRFYSALEAAEIKPNNEVLDIGSGRGEIAFLAANKGADVVAVDYSPSAVDLINQSAKELLKKKKGRVKARVMDAQNLKFEDATFNKIFFLEILEHLYPKELDKAFKEMIKVLKPGGKIIISTGPNKYLMDILLWLAKMFFGEVKWESRRYHVNEQTYYSLKKYLRKLNLSFQIFLHEEPNWFYGQIAENPLFNPRWKTLIKIFNTFYDFEIFRLIRRLPLLKNLLCTSFLVVVNKKN